MAPKASLCLECGAPLEAGSSQGLCLQCLRSRGSDPARKPADSITPTEIGPSSERSTLAALPREGQRFGDYQLGRLLGRGGMGAVYEADHLPSERRVALKVLGHSLDSPDARKRFLREGRLAASVNHPNSVYVYGTEEIDGIPIIAMELVAGGTLKDRVQRDGPLPVAQAVDVILQVIAGLEAAQAKGVLHRDIKPTNCFVDAGGTVKVGDYGLSLSLTARGETQLTLQGAFLGTPAFSSPEQLRGAPLDVRSDIYSVGVTLYYLLTGRAPFEGENVVNVLATVLQNTPVSPASLRPEVPPELARVVLHSIEKLPEKRFQDYGQLRQALLPFSSETPHPAALGLRFGASFVDALILALLFAIWQALFPVFNFHRDLFPNRPGEAVSPWVTQLSVLLVTLLYYGISEGLWGASPGKRQCRLRVIGADRNAPGIPRAVLRALIFSVFPVLPAWIDVTMGSGLNPKSPWTGALAFSFFPMLGLLFVTARRKNGLAAIHDLLSGTRVIQQRRPLARPAIAMTEEVVPAQGGAQLGQFSILAALWTKEGEQLLLASEPQLQRKVWIHVMPDSTAPVPPQRRTLGRAGRIRWLDGRRRPGENWDAYEAPSGTPFLALVRQPQSWKLVRHWLLDLVEELSAAQKDQSLPRVLSLDRIWITPEGRIQLLDFPAPGTSLNTPGPAPPPGPPQDLDLTRFAIHVARTALSVKRTNGEPAGQGDRPAPPPLHATKFLSDFEHTPAIGALIEPLKSILHLEPEIPRSDRVKLLFLSSFPLLGASFIGGIAIALADTGIEQRGTELINSYVVMAIVVGGLLWLPGIVIPSLIGSLFFRGGYALHRMGIAVIRDDGTEATRLRVFSRSLVAWGLAALFFGLTFFLVAGTLYTLGIPFWAVVLLCHVLFIGGALWANRTPSRGPHDVLVGTWLVPK